jgi:hypothetical protein
MQRLCAPYLLVFLLFVPFFFSCGPQKKAVTATKKELSAVDDQLTDRRKTLDELEIQRENKQEQNEIDDTTSTRIQKFINNTRIEIDTMIGNNQILIGETIINKSDWGKLREALTLSQNNLKFITTKVSFINDLLTRNTVVKLDQDVLFGPGQYIVTENVAKSIGSFFEPAAKEIDLFVKKYPDFPLSLVITAKGYSDATSIAKGSKLYNDLKERLRLTGAEPGQQELNKELSRARAEAVISLFKNFTTGRSSGGGNIRNIVYLYEGKGDAFPDKNISDYKNNDARRRVVLLFWSVFPE